MTKWEHGVCKEICAIGRRLRPKVVFRSLVEMLFQEWMGTAMVLAGWHWNRQILELYLDACKSFTAVLAKCGDPSYDPLRDPDRDERWQEVNLAQLLSSLALSERVKLIDLLAHLVHRMIDRLVGAWGDDARFKAAVSDSIEAGHRIRGVDVDPGVMAGSPPPGLHSP